MGWEVRQGWTEFTLQNTVNKKYNLICVLVNMMSLEQLSYDEVGLITNFFSSSKDIFSLMKTSKFFYTFLYDENVIGMCENVYFTVKHDPKMTVPFVRRVEFNVVNFTQILKRFTSATHIRIIGRINKRNYSREEIHVGIFKEPKNESVQSVEYYGLGCFFPKDGNPKDELVITGLFNMFPNLRRFSYSHVDLNKHSDTREFPHKILEKIPTSCQQKMEELSINTFRSPHLSTFEKTLPNLKLLEIRERNHLFSHLRSNSRPPSDFNGWKKTLKVLRLKHVIGNYTKILGWVLEKFPNLEELELHHGRKEGVLKKLMNFDGSQYVNLKMKKLSLEMNDCEDVVGYVDFLSKIFPNVVDFKFELINDKKEEEEEKGSITEDVKKTFLIEKVLQFTKLKNLRLKNLRIPSERIAPIIITTSSSPSKQQLYNIHSISLHDLEFDDSSLFSFLSYCERVKDLTIDYTISYYTFRKSKSKSIKFGNELENLKLCRLENCSITHTDIDSEGFGRMLRCFASSSPSLISLDCQHNSISQNISIESSSSASPKSLMNLDLSHNKIEDLGMNGICGFLYCLPSLSKFRCEYNLTYNSVSFLPFQQETMKLPKDFYEKCCNVEEIIIKERNMGITVNWVEEMLKLKNIKKFVVQVDDHENIPRISNEKGIDLKIGRSKVVFVRFIHQSGSFTPLELDLKEDNLEKLKDMVEEKMGVPKQSQWRHIFQGKDLNQVKDVNALSLWDMGVRYGKQIILILDPRGG